MKAKVNILVTANKPETFESCTLCFDSIRTGFPSSHFTVDCFVNSERASALGLMAYHKALDCGNFDYVGMLGEPMFHHAEFIQGVVREASDSNQPQIFVDPDTIWWDSCVPWLNEFSGSLLAGYYVPQIWNDFAKAISYPRLHTSNLWFMNPANLCKKVVDIYPYCWEPTGEYCPLDVMRPRTMFINQTPVFWDTAANLYNVLDPKEVIRFTDEHKACFDHLNSASFFDVMCERMDDPSGMRMVHITGVKPGNQHLLKNLWQYVDAYYQRKAIEALVKQRTPSLHATHSINRGTGP